MSCEVEYTNEFGAWWSELREAEQVDVAAMVALLEARDVRLAFPHSSAIRGSRHGHMRELRIQSGGKPIRVFYAFDPRRNAILLIGGDKTGDDRFYASYVPMADALYDEHRNKFAALRAGLSPAQSEAVEQRIAELRAEMTLAELRQARQLTQQTLSGTLNVGQAAVAKMERRTDMYVGNLRRFVEAMGGELDVIARFPEGSVKISNFGDIGDAPA
jgi:hypothetical protein